MGLLITNQLSTNAGVTTEAYLNIAEITVRRRESIKVKTNLYLSLQAKAENDKATVNSNLVYSSIHFDISESFIDVEEVAIYELAYAKLKEALIANGLEVEDQLA
jgi:hypothetical protein